MQVRDAGRNVVKSSSFLISVQLMAPGYPGEHPILPISGQTEQTTVHGVAVFDGLILYRNGSGYRLHFQAAGLLDTFSEPFSVRVGPAAALVVVQQPSLAWGGIPMQIQPTLELQDRGGNMANVTTVASVQLVIDIPWSVENTSSGLSAGPNQQPSINGTTKVQMIHGFAAFSDLTVDLIGQNYRLNFSASYFWALSNNFSVAKSGPSRLAVIRGPGGCRGGEICDQQPILLVLDYGGNAADASEVYVTVSANTTSNEALYDPITIAHGLYPLVNGVLNFKNLSIDMVGEYTMLFESPNLGEARSEKFDVNFGNPRYLHISGQPGDGIAGLPIESPVVVYFVDSGNNAITLEGLNVSIRLNYTIYYKISQLGSLASICNQSVSAVSPNYSADYLSVPSKCQKAICKNASPTIRGEIAAVTQHDGNAYFTDLVVNVAGYDYSLTIWSPSFRFAAETELFSIQLGSPTMLDIVCSPKIEISCHVFTIQPIIQITDAGNNHLDVTYSLSELTVGVELIHIPGYSALLIGSRAAKIYRDFIIFTDLRIDEVGAYLLQFSGKGSICSNNTFETGLCSPVNSTRIEIISGSPVGFAVSAPASVMAGESFSFNISLRDSGGNVATDNTSRFFEASAYKIAKETIYFQCRGKQSCVVNLNTSRPKGVVQIISLGLTVNLSCTDFSLPRDYVSQVRLWDIPLAKDLFDSGPWDGCYGSCTITRQVLKGLNMIQPFCWDDQNMACTALPSIGIGDFSAADGSRWEYLQRFPKLNQSVIPLQLYATPTVNYFSCDGYYVNAVVELDMVYLAREDSKPLGTFEMQNGVLTVSSAVIDDLGSLYSILCRAVGFESSFSAQISVVHGPVSGIMITQQPGNGTGNTILSPQPAVMITDKAGNIINDASSYGFVFAKVSFIGNLHNNSFNFEGIDKTYLSGTVCSALNGMANFSDLFVGTASWNYSYHLVFSFSRNSAGPPFVYFSQHSEPFFVTVGVPYKLLVIQQPIRSFGGDLLLQQPVVAVVDFSDNICDVVSYVVVSVSIENNGGVVGQLSGTQRLVLTSGVLTFRDLSIDFAGVGYTLLFSTDEYGSVESMPFDIVSGPAFRLVMKRQPLDSQLLMLFSVQPSVEVQDRGGNLVPAWVGTVSVLVQNRDRSGYPGDAAPDAHLLGNVTVSVRQGVAYFWNLRLDSPGVNYVLKFISDPSLLSVSSAPFSIYAEPAAALKILKQPYLTKYYLTMSALVVAAVDENDVIDVRFSKSVAVSVQVVSGWPSFIGLSGTTQLNFVEGIAIFTNLVFFGNESNSTASVARLIFFSEEITQQSESILVIDAWIGWWKIESDLPWSGMKSENSQMSQMSGYLFLKVINQGRLIGTYLCSQGTFWSPIGCEGTFLSYASPFSYFDSRSNIVVLKGDITGIKIGVTALISYDGPNIGYISYPANQTIRSISKQIPFNALMLLDLCISTDLYVESCLEFKLEITMVAASDICFVAEMEPANLSCVRSNFVLKGSCRRIQCTCCLLKQEEYQPSHDPPCTCGIQLLD